MATSSKLKMIFGFILLSSLVLLAGSIALGKVEEKYSYGLLEIIGVIAVLSGGFANWAFGHHLPDPGETREKEQYEESKTAYAPGDSMQSKR